VVTGWKPVADPAVLARLDEAARGHVLQADLRSQGVTDLGEMQPGPTWAQSEPGLELLFQDQPMTLARWPNAGFAKKIGLYPSDDRAVGRSATRFALSHIARAVSHGEVAPYQLAGVTP